MDVGSSEPAHVHRTLCAALDGDHAAWPVLMKAWQPTLQAMARAHRGLRAKQLVGDDDVAEVVTATFERLRRRDFASLRRYLEQLERADGETSARSLDTWLFGTLDFAVRAHLRARYGRAPKRDGQPHQLSKRDLGSHAARLPNDDALQVVQVAQLAGVTAQMTIAEIWEIVEREFAADEICALRMHFEEDRSFAEIAERLQLHDAAAAERLIRRLNARLRHRFPADDDAVRSQAPKPHKTS